MACVDENALMRYLEGVLSLEHARALEEHLAACDECRWLLSVAVADSERRPQEGGLSLLPTRQRVDDGSPRQAPMRRGDDEILKGTYTVESYIGRGGMGEVFLASHVRLHRRFAIKFLSGGAAENPQAVARMRLEAEVTSRLKHPNIVEVTDFDYTQDGVPYIVMELLEGESLARRLRRAGPFRDMAEAASILRQMTSALEAAHREGVVHRDLKPTNIFLSAADPYPLVKVMDFGISKVLGTPGGLTADMEVLGSPRYMAPEQALGRSAEVDGRADIFALGVIIFEMLAGEPPFAGESVPETLFKVVYEEPATPASWSAVPEPLQRVILRCLSKDPNGRPASMGQLWREIARALDTIAGGAGKRSSRATLHRRWVIAAGACLTAGLGILGYLHISRAPDPPRGAAPPLLTPSPKVSLEGGVALEDRRTTARDAGRHDGSGASDAGRRDGARADEAARDAGLTPPAHPRRERRVGCLVVQSKEQTGEHMWANARVDGRSLGQTPLTLKRIQSGQRSVEISRPGYQTITRRVRVAPGKCTKVTFTLRQAGRTD